MNTRSIVTSGLGKPEFDGGVGTGVGSTTQLLGSCYGGKRWECKRGRFFFTDCHGIRIISNYYIRSTRLFFWYSSPCLSHAFPRATVSGLSTATASVAPCPTVWGPRSIWIHCTCVCHLRFRETIIWWRCWYWGREQDGTCRVLLVINVRRSSCRVLLVINVRRSSSLTANVSATSTTNCYDRNTQLLFSYSWP